MITDSEGNELAVDAMDKLLAAIKEEIDAQVSVLTDIHRLAKRLTSAAAVKRRQNIDGLRSELAMAATKGMDEFINPDLETAVAFLENSSPPDVDDIAGQVEQALTDAFPEFKDYRAELEEAIEDTPKRAFFDVEEPPPPPPRQARRSAPARASAPASGERFAQDVLAVLPSIKTQTGPSGKDMGRYGSESVFISAAWRRLKSQPGYKNMSLDEFKQRLIAANRNAELSLVRADMVDDMDPEEVEMSDTDDGYGLFNFIIDPAAR